MSVQNHRADRLAFVHQVEGVVDLVERHGVGDEVVDVDLAVHIPVDDFRDIGAAARAAEGGAAPDAAGDEMERARGDFMTGRRDADDDRFAPAAVAAFERLPHDVHIADAFKGEIGAALRDVDDGLHDFVFADLIRVDEMRHTEFLGHGALARISVDADDFIRADHARSLQDVQTDAAEAEDRDIGAGPDFRRVDDGADAGGDAATDVANFIDCLLYT